MRFELDEGLVHGLVAEQFPAWAGLTVRALDLSGNDHRMFGLGERMVVRLPSGPGYAPQVAKEQRWLPALAPRLPLPIPTPVAAGTPTGAFPAAWSVYDWIEGVRPTHEAFRDDVRGADDLAAFLVALRRIDATDGPEPGLHSAFRGGPLERWDAEMQDLVARVGGRERDSARGLWRDALDAPFAGPPVWVHGDVAIANLLMRDGRLSAVVDWGCSAVGDPACDTVILWTQFRGPARDAFREGMGLDDGTWARGRGWALWKGLLMLHHEPSEQVAFGRRVLDELFAGG